MTRADLDAVNELLTALYRQRDRFGDLMHPAALAGLHQRIVRWEEKRDGIEESLHEQWCASNNIDVVRS